MKHVHSSASFNTRNRRRSCRRHHKALQCCTDNGDSDDKMRNGWVYASKAITKLNMYKKPCICPWFLLQHNYFRMLHFIYSSINSMLLTKTHFYEYYRIVISVSFLCFFSDFNWLKCIDNARIDFNDHSTLLR